jgi:uncharacterized C2H2 Zn-finger protein
VANQLVSVPAGRGSLIKHNSRIFQCERCPKCFTRKVALKNHLNAHENKRPHTCNHCSAAFVRKNDLNRHLLTHSTIPKVTCPTCQKEFNRTDVYLNHIRSIHNQEIPRIARKEHRKAPETMIIDLTKEDDGSPSQKPSTSSITSRPTTNLSEAALIVPESPMSTKSSDYSWNTNDVDQNHIATQVLHDIWNGTALRSSGYFGILNPKIHVLGHNS